MASRFGLPLDLGDGLRLRFARKADTDAILDFDVGQHADAETPAEPFRAGVRSLLTGEHPTTRASDFTIVTQGDRIVSSLCLIHQTWALDGVPFGCGRPEFVGTDPEFRRRGLVRHQMEAVHRLSAARGERVQAITGIPWYYRMFGYEMGLDLGGGRRYYWPPAAKAPAEERYAWRRARPRDIPLLAKLYALHSARSLVVTVRDRATWLHEISAEATGAGFARCFRMLTTADGEPVGYTAFRPAPSMLRVMEFAAVPGRSWREIGLFLTRRLRVEAEERRAVDGKDRGGHAVFGLGTDHPLYDALGRELHGVYPPYAWYVRVADVRGFLRHVRPLLERRLAESVLAGHTGELKLNLVHDHPRLRFEGGRIAGIGEYRPKRLEDGDAILPDHSFLRLLFGHASPDDLQQSRADCYASEEARILLGILFPRRASLVAGLM